MFKQSKSYPRFPTCLYFFFFAQAHVFNSRYYSVASSVVVDNYRIAYPHPEDFVIELLVNPCGVNDTTLEVDHTFPLGYDCCMHRFGRGEFGFMKYLPSSSSSSSSKGGDEEALSQKEIFEKMIPAGPDEVLHNQIIVDEYGVEIPYEHSRRADDHTIMDETCIGLRDPHTSCIQSRLRAFMSPYVPSCWDHNQTVDATASCYSPQGIKEPHCMQVAFAQNAFIYLCGRGSTSDPSCGTFIEVHRANGSPYDSENTIISDTRLTTEETNGMVTTTIDLTYKGNENRILCAYNETKIRIGSMVKISEDSPQCCCPPTYNRITKHGSFFCPRKKGAVAGPFMDALDTIEEQLENDEDQERYPFCHDTHANEDVLMCSREIGGSTDTTMEEAVIEKLIGLDTSLFYTDKCQSVTIGDNGMFTSADLLGQYEEQCPLGKAYYACGTNHDNVCKAGDSSFNFWNKVGKVTSLPIDEDFNLYGITFNDGRTTYYFSQDQIELQEPYSNYELWFVQRNRFEKILQKRKGFRVVWPECTFDPANDRYFPFAEKSSDGGNFVKVLAE